MGLEVEALEPRVLLAFTFAGQEFSAGLDQPATVAVADYDGDGTADMAVANASGNDVSILLGTGSASFTPVGTRPGVGPAPRGIAAGDLDGDGLPDLIVANSLASTVTVLRNLGGGAFAPGVEVSVGARPRALTVGDFNGDGLTDVAVALFSTHRLGVLFNTGGGVLGGLATFAVGGEGPIALAAADLDGDGDIDLATANITSGNVSVLRNSGLGVFSMVGTHAVGSVPRAIVAADVDGEGAVDLVVANAFSGTVSVVRNLGGSFAAQREFAAGEQPHGLVVLDLDGDGLLDVATVNLVGQDVSILGNAGGGVLLAPVRFGAGSGAIAIAAGDLDADGDPDLAVANSLSNTMTVLWGGLSEGNMPPQIGAVVVTPTTAVAGRGMTIEAQGVTDPDGAVSQVRFYRDSNGDGLLNPTDESLPPADFEGGDGWSWTGTASAAWEPGVNRFFAQAFDNLGRAGNLAAVEVMLLHPPRITALSVSPGRTTPGQAMTLTASGVTDLDGTVQFVRMYRDANGSGALDEGDEQLTTVVTDGAGNYSWTGTADAAWGPGFVRFFARAGDETSLMSAVATTVVTQTFAPTLAAAAAAPDPFIFGEDVTLTATGTADQDGTVVGVQFYADVNGNGALDLGIDELLGIDVDGGDGYSIVAAYPTEPGPVGTAKFLAVAMDNLGVRSEPVAFSGAIRYRPVVDILFADGFEVEPGETLTLTALASDFDGSVGSVSFYRDSNGDGAWDVEDELLGTDTDGGDGFSVGVTAEEPWGPEYNTFFARAVDDQGLASDVGETSVLVNYRPTVEDVSVSDDPVEYFEELLVTALAVDDDGFVSEVLLFRDVDGDGVISEADEFLGAAVNIVESVFELLVTVSPEWGPGETTILAAAVDGFGSLSDALGVVVTVIAVPEIGALVAAPNPTQLLSSFTLTAEGVHHDDGVVESVAFYRDSNGDGEFDFDDEFLGSDESSAGGWMLGLTALAEWGRGFQTFFAVAMDAQERMSPPSSAVLAIGTLPLVGGMTAEPSALSAGQEVTLTATGVSSADGTIESVLFFRDADGDGELDVEELAEPFFGEDQGGGVWRAVVAVEPAWSGGVNRFFVLAFDDIGLQSAARSATFTVTALPGFGPLMFFEPAEPFVGGELTLRTSGDLEGGPLSSAIFFRDRNGDGVLDEGDEELDFRGVRIAGATAIWTGVVPDSWSAGPNTFFAVPVGPGGAHGAAVSVVLDIWARVFLPEGWRNDTTINEYLPIVNHNAFEVTYRVVARYEVGERDQVLFEGTIPAFSRGGITISERGRPEFALPRLNVGYALEVQSSAPVGAMLSRYDNFSGDQSPKDSVANGEAFTSVTSQSWTFADVQKAPFEVFDFLVYYNPTEADGSITFTLLYESGAAVQFVFDAPALRRGGVNFNAEHFIHSGRFSVLMESTVPVIAAQSRYVAATGQGFTTLGEPSMGQSSNFVPFLDTRPGVANTLVLLNTSGTDLATAAVKVYYEDEGRGMPEDGEPDVVLNFELAPRMPLHVMLDQMGLEAGRRVSLRIDSDAPVVVQASSGDSIRGDGIATTVTSAQTGWLFADAFLDATTAGVVGFEYLTLSNPGAEAVTASVLLYRTTGVEPEELLVELAAGQTRTVEMHGPGSLALLDMLNFYAIGVFSASPLVATFTHWDLFQNGGWVTYGTPVGALPLE